MFQPLVIFGDRVFLDRADRQLLVSLPALAILESLPRPDPYSYQASSQQQHCLRFRQIRLDTASQIATGRTLHNDVVEAEIPTCAGCATQDEAKGEVWVVKD